MIDDGDASSWIRAHLMIVPAEFGGRRHGTSVGLRPGIRWTRFIDDPIGRTNVVDRVEAQRDGSVIVEGRTVTVIEEQMAAPGLQIELLDGPHVFAVGKLLAALVSAPPTPPAPPARRPSSS